MIQKKIEKIIKSLEVDISYIFNADPLCIDELQDFLNEAKGNNATHVRLIPYLCEGLDSVEIEAVNITLESEEDYLKRVAEHESIRLEKDNLEKAKEKALYEELKLKYGD